MLRPDGSRLILSLLLLIVSFSSSCCCCCGCGSVGVSAAAAAAVTTKDSVCHGSSPGSCVWLDVVVPRGGGGGGRRKPTTTTMRRQEDQNNCDDDDDDHGAKKAGLLTVEEYVALMEELDQKQIRHQRGWFPGLGRNHDDDSGGGDDPSTTDETPSSNDNQKDDTAVVDDKVVGVKEHHHHRHHHRSKDDKKSNAVGDPDGEGSDSDDDSDSENSDFEEEWQELQRQLELNHQQQVQVQLDFVQQQQTDPDDNLTEDELSTLSSSSSYKERTTSATSGGVGVRLGQRFNRRNANNQQQQQHSWRSNSQTTNSSTTTTTTTQPSLMAQKNDMLQEAWLPHLYLPPSSKAVTYLQLNARMFDAASKSRLDRRTLYAGLLLEWMLLHTHSSSSKNSNKNNPKYIPRRKFLHPSTSQALQSALSLATQPKWRNIYPRQNAIRFYDYITSSTPPTPAGPASNNNNNNWMNPIDMTQQQQQQQQSNTPPSSSLFRDCTLAMQETIAMALAHSLGAGMLILDDSILESIRSRLLAIQLESTSTTTTTQDKQNEHLFTEDDVTPTALIQSLFQFVKHHDATQLRQIVADETTPAPLASAKISTCMKQDLDLGLDDPFDERATASCHEMIKWEEGWNKDDNDDAATSSSQQLTANNESNRTTTTSYKNSVEKNNSNKPKQPLSLVVFLRSESSNSIFNSQSAMDILLRECSSDDSINLVVLGKGVNVKTTTLPPPQDHPDSASNHQQHQQYDSQSDPRGSAMNGAAAPWFGFSPHNQNASGQNDPEGSRRFNIFLARTVDPATGTPGILGAIAPPQAGNLFPHMMAMQARERLQHQQSQSQQQGDDGLADSPVKAELERWAQMLKQQMQTNGGSPLPPPQFFNASLSSSFDSTNNNNNNNAGEAGFSNLTPPSPEAIQQTLQQAMSELLDRLAMMNDQGESGEFAEPDGNPNLSPDLHKAFAQVLRNENLRRGIAENLARAAPALSDPKCQGVMLSVYVPPPPHHMNRGKLPGSNAAAPATPGAAKPNTPSPNVGGGWFQKILNNQEGEGEINSDTSSTTNNNTNEAKKESSDNHTAAQLGRKERRQRTIATAAAVMATKQQQERLLQEQQQQASEPPVAERNLARLESLARPIVAKTPSDPVRAKSWDAWIARERGAVVFRHNRRVLNEHLERRSLSLQEHVGTNGAGSALRQMLSVRDIADEMTDVIKCAIELEAAKAQRQQETSDEMHEKELSLGIDITLSQLLLTEEGSLVEQNTQDENDDVDQVSAESMEKTVKKEGLQYVHPSSLETALTMVCRISPSPSGGLTLPGGSSLASHRTREEILSLAQDKHERALVSQVVSPQDIGVTYDMIGGLNEVKELLRQSITYPLKFPHLYSEGIAREAVKGVLLFGPPGTGKTMLAKAVATEGGASFLSVDASSVENKWLGESEKNAKAVFTLARRLAPCVIFIDEVDSLLSSREGSSDDSAHGTLTSVKTTMMSEWDGLNSGTNGLGEAGSDRVIVIGSTNRPFDLDEAVLRRFPRRILVDLPDLETRTEILEVTLAENRLDPSVNLTKIAERLEGYTGSDIKEVCREAVVQISHEQARVLDQGILPDSGSDGGREADITQGSLQRLRPVTVEDFEKALRKLKRSVSEKGRELARVWEWNDEYGEIKKEARNHLPHLANMYL